MKSNLLLFIILVIGIIFTSCNAKKTGSDISEDKSIPSEQEKSHYFDNGREIAKLTFKVLSSNLKGAMQEGGVEKAISYCNVRAMPLVDSLSQAHEAKIRRTSLKVRNSKNRPDQNESKALNAYARKFDQGLDLSPKIIQETDDSIHLAAPILIKPLCLNCHGVVGSTMSQTNYDYIRKYYPEDEAIGYGLDDFRGMWSIKFAKDK